MMLDHLVFLARGNRKDIKGQRNKVDLGDAKLRKVTIDIVGDDNEIMISENVCLTETLVRLRGRGHRLSIGKSCRIKGTLWFEDSECSIEIGEGTTIQGCGISAIEPGANIRIGRDCMLSYGVDVRTSDSHSIIDLETGKRINYAKDIIIDDHVWIGANVQILKGVRIGTGSIIATRSVVVKDVPANSVAAGVPATVIRENVTWDRKRIYEAPDKQKRAHQA